MSRRANQRKRINRLTQARDLLGPPYIPGNPDPHAPANRKERPWHPPRERASHPLSDYPAGMTIDPEAQRRG